MNKRELTQDIRDCIGGGGLITRTQLAKYLKKSRNINDGVDELKPYLEGLSYVPDGRGKKYFIADVAEKILINMVRQ